MKVCVFGLSITVLCLLFGINVGKGMPGGPKYTSQMIGLFLYEDFKSIIQPKICLLLGFPS